MNSNGPTEAVNNLVKRVKRVAFGMRNFPHYRIRALPTPAGRTGHYSTPSPYPETRKAGYLPRRDRVNITARRNGRFGRRCTDCALRSPLHHRDPWADHRSAPPTTGCWPPPGPFATTDAFTGPYRQHRPVVERSTAWLVRGSRRLRYRGTDRNRLWLGHHVAAVNLQRLINLGLTHRPDGWASPDQPRHRPRIDRSGHDIYFTPPRCCTDSHWDDIKQPALAGPDGTDCAAASQ